MHPIQYQGNFQKSCIFVFTSLYLFTSKIGFTSEMIIFSFRFLSMSKFHTIEAETPRRTRYTKKVSLFNDTSVIDQLDFKSMLLLTPKYVSSSATYPGKYRRGAFERYNLPPSPIVSVQSVIHQFERYVAVICK